MTYIQPPHEVVDQEKFDAMVHSLENGESLPAVVVLDRGNEYVAVTGSHRIAAWDACDMEPDFLVIGDEDYEKAARKLAPWSDEFVPLPNEMELNDLCETLYNIVADDEIKAALEDQRGW